MKSTYNIIIFILFICIVLHAFSDSFNPNDTTTQYIVNTVNDIIGLDVLVYE